MRFFKLLLFLTNKITQPQYLIVFFADQCSYCLPDCQRVIFSQSVSAQPFRRCDERNVEMTKFCSVLNKNVVKPEIWGRQMIDYYINTTGKVPEFLSNVTSSKRTIKKSYLLNYLFKGISREYDAYEKDIAVLNVFFDTTTVMTFNSESQQTWIDYFSSVGGALGLCIGLSVITVVELFWLCCRLCHVVMIDPNRVVPF